MLLASKNAAIFTTKTIELDVLLSKLFWTHKKVSHTNRGYGTQGFHETLLSFSYCLMYKCWCHIPANSHALGVSLTPAG